MKIVERSLATLHTGMPTYSQIKEHIKMEKNMERSLSIVPIVFICLNVHFSIIK